jgi:hypothetical protein
MIALIIASLVDVAKPNAYTFPIFFLIRILPMAIITNLFTRQCATPQELYKAFEIDDVSKFFTNVKKVPTTILIDTVLDVNDENKTLRILNYDALFALAELYNTGDLAAGIPNSLKRYQICLAMIAMDGSNSEIHDLRANHKALTLLKEFYETHLKENISVAGKTLLELVSLKIEPNEQFTQATMIPSAKVVPSGKAFKDSSHIAQPVTYQSDAKAENSKVRFIKKHEVDARVAGIEVFVGTLMQLFLGLGQPTTFQEEKKVNGTVPILSEEINFKRFSEEATFKKWADNGFKHAAEADVACVFLADDDCSLKNAGLREDNGLPVRIDFDKSIAPITLRLVGKQNQPKKQRINNTDYVIAGLFEVEGFAIHADDFNNLPLLATKMPRAEIILNHFVPSHWWPNNFINNPEIYDKIKALQTDPDYQDAKFRALLEKIILPYELIKFIADLTLFHAEDKKEVLAWMKTRQLQLSSQAENVRGFGDYIKTSGARALGDLKTSFESFTVKRKKILVFCKTHSKMAFS